MYYMSIDAQEDKLSDGVKIANNSCEKIISSDKRRRLSVDSEPRLIARWVAAFSFAQFIRFSGSLERRYPLTEDRHNANVIDAFGDERPPCLLAADVCRLVSLIGGNRWRVSLL